MKIKNTLTALALGLGSLATAQSYDWNEVFYRNQTEFSTFNVDNNTQPLKVNLSVGRYKPTIKRQVSSAPLWLYSKEGAEIDDVSITATDYFRCDNITFGHQTENLNETGIVKGQGEFHNCRFLGDTRFGLDSEYQSVVKDCSFTDNPYTAIQILTNTTKPNEIPNLILSNNTFDNCKCGIYTQKEVSTENFGENIFENCDYVLYNYFSGSQNIPNCYVADEVVTKSGNGWIVYDDVSVLEKIIDATGTANITTIPFRPLPKCDWDDDLKVSATDIQICINQALDIPYSTENVELADVNHDGVVSAIDIQQTINQALGIK